MVVIELCPRDQWPRVELGVKAGCDDIAAIEAGLLELAIRLDHLRCSPWKESELRALLGLSTRLGLFEITIQLRDLRVAKARDDVPAIAALLARIDRQIEADLGYVLAVADSAGQPDMGD